MTFEKKFAEFKKELEKRNASELPTDLAMQVTMTDEDCGGTFYIANVGGNFAVEPYDYVDNTVNIAAAAATLKDLLAGKLDGPDAMFRGLEAGRQEDRCQETGCEEDDHQEGRCSEEGCREESRREEAGCQEGCCSEEGR